MPSILFFEVHTVHHVHTVHQVHTVHDFRHASRVTCPAPLHPHPVPRGNSKLFTGAAVAHGDLDHAAAASVGERQTRFCLSVGAQDGQGAGSAGRDAPRWVA
ncbi:MAG TPA: hypothetical protein VN367_10395, partial [Chlorobaculum sp.]|nr:hypothetical protein [Chlorobaculum sp.]